MTGRVAALLAHCRCCDVDQTGERDTLLGVSLTAKGLCVCSADHQDSRDTRLNGRIGRSRRERTVTLSTPAWQIIWMRWRRTLNE